MTVPEFGYEYLCGAGSPDCTLYMRKDDKMCRGCRLWFPKPENCTCSYDAGWIHLAPDCPAHRELWANE